MGFISDEMHENLLPFFFLQNIVVDSIGKPEQLSTLNMDRDMCSSAVNKTKLTTRDKEIDVCKIGVLLQYL